MHTRAARKLGESRDRMHLLNAWREALVFTPRERAALAWTEALTLVSQTMHPTRSTTKCTGTFRKRKSST